MLNPNQADFLEKYLGIQCPEPALITETDTGEIDRLRDVLVRLKRDVDGVLDAFPNLAADLRDSLAHIESALNSHDADTARSGVMELGARLKSLVARADDMKELSKAMPVKIGLAAIDWRAICEDVSEQITEVRDAMTAEIDEPDLAEQAKKLTALATEFTQHGEALSDSMKSVMDSVDDTERTLAAKSTIQAIDACLSFAKGSAILEHLLDHPLEDSGTPDADRLLYQPLEKMRTELTAIA